MASATATAGSGAHNLAILLEQLLDDITAATPRGGEQVSEGLLELVAQDWPTGTMLTRHQLIGALQSG